MTETSFDPTKYTPLGFRALLVGASGSGKTHALRTLVDCGITPFVVFTEPGMRTVADVGCDHLHYKYIPPAAPTWADLIANATMVNTLSFKALTGLSEMNKSKYGQFIEVLTAMNNFVCDRCGQAFGDVATWGTDRAIVIDSLSGLSIMAMDLAVGAKPVKSVGDWGVAMDNLERFILSMTSLPSCHFILTAHLEREHDEITGATQLMPSTLGKKLAPKMPRNFDDVILCQNKEGRFTWATMGLNVDLKWRNLPPGKEFLPTFKPLVDSWIKNGGGVITRSPEPKEVQAK